MQKVSDELGLTLEELVGDYGPEQPVPCWMMRATLCRWMRRKLRLGPKREKPGERPAPTGDSALFKTVPYNRQEQKKRLDKARRDLAALGKINPLATEEFEALEERNQVSQ